MAKTRQQLLEILADAGVVCRESGGGGRRRPLLGRRGAPVVTALICAALFPQVAFVVRKDTLSASLGGRPRAGPVEIMVRERGSEVARGENLSIVHIHPSSILAREKFFGSPFLVYHELVRTSRPYLRQVAPAPPLALALFGGALGAHSWAGAAAGDGGEAVLSLGGGQVLLAMPGDVAQNVREARMWLDTMWKATLEGRTACAPTEALLEPLSRLLSEQVDDGPGDAS